VLDDERPNLFAVAVLPGGGFVVLDTALTPELEAEGWARDLVRQIQDERKAVGLHVSDPIRLRLTVPQQHLGTTQEFRPVFEDKQRPDAAVVSSGVAALPYVPDPLPFAAFDLLPHEVLLVGTDGFGDPLGDGTGQVGQLFARHLAAPPPPRGLAHLLDFSRETFDDDRTLLAVWPRHDRQEAP